MDTEKIIIYVLIGLVYYGYKYFFKNFGVPKETTKPQADPPKAPFPNTIPPKKSWSVPPKEQEQKQTIFDLLEEIKKQEEAKKKSLEIPSTTSYETWETTNYETEREKVAIENVNPYAQYHSVEVENAPAEKSFKESIYEEYMPKRATHPFLKAFKNKNKVREAFILGEILERKF